MPISQAILEQILTGHDPTCGVVAVEPAGRFFRLFIRDHQGITIHDRPFHPFILLKAAELITRAGVPCTVEELVGTGQYRYRAWFDSWHDCSAMADYLQRSTGVPHTASTAPYLFLPDSTRQFLLASGVTFFKGLDITQLRSMQVSIVTNATTGSLAPDNECLVALELKGSDGQTACLRVDQLGEQQLLGRAVSLLAEFDPDLVLLDDDQERALLSVVERARQLGVKLAWGRNGAEPFQVRRSTGRGDEQQHWGIYGRLVVSGKQTTAATLVQGRILPQFVPWQTRRPGALLNELLVREYFRRGQALPDCSTTPAVKAAAAKADQVCEGMYGPVVHCDLTLLEPAILLSYQLKPGSDDLGVTLPLLNFLHTNYTNGSTAQSKPEHQQGWQDQASLAVYKNLIHDLVAMVYSPLKYFADLRLAAELQRLGQVVRTDMTGWLKEQAAQPLHLDGSGIYFVPPEGHDGSEELVNLVGRMSSVLPSGVQLQIDGRYQAMITYKQGNYALLTRDGQVLVKGSSLLPHGHEQYLHDFVHDVLKVLLEGRLNEVHPLLTQYLRRLSDRAVPIRWVMQTEALAESLDQYQQQVANGQRHRSAAYELALRSRTACKTGDRIHYYVVGSSADITLYNHVRRADEYDPAHPDLNLAWYAEKLRQTLKRLTVFIPDQPTLFD